MAFTIKELELLSGIKAHTIRIWEQRYNFLKPARTTTNIRTYTNEELKTLLTVALLNKYGVKVSRIDDMAPEQRKEAILALNAVEAKQELLVNELIGYMIEVKPIEFEKTIHQYIQQHNLTEALKKVIFPFMEKTGILWQAERINPAQEHIVSNIIRQKIISAIEALPVTTDTEPLFLLFLPEEEHHEIGLLFVYYLLRERSLPVIYLGANVPLSDVQYLICVKKPAYLYLHLTSFPHRQRFEKFLHPLLRDCATNSCTLLISGNLKQFYSKPLPPEVMYLSSFSHILSFLSSLKAEQ